MAELLTPLDAELDRLLQAPKPPFHETGLLFHRERRETCSVGSPQQAGQAFRVDRCDVRGSEEPQLRGIRVGPEVRQQRVPYRQFV